jgi:hypothetical protein
MLNDFIILAIPFPPIAQLQMTLRKKLAICGIMAVGILYVGFIFLSELHLVNGTELFVAVFLLPASCESIISLSS